MEDTDVIGVSEGESLEEFDQFEMEVVTQPQPTRSLSLQLFEIQNNGHESNTPSSLTPVLTPTSSYYSFHRKSEELNPLFNHYSLTASLDPEDFRSSVPEMETPRRSAPFPSVNSPRAPRIKRRFHPLSTTSELDLRNGSNVPNGNILKNGSHTSRTGLSLLVHTPSYPQLQMKRSPKKKQFAEAPEGLLPSLYDPQIPRQRISCETVISVLNGIYNDSCKKIWILDCRSEREFEGGHIKGAQNININEIENFFYDCLELYQKTGETFFFIFHCEFSKIRGPKCWDRFRQLDRKEKGYTNYPQVFFPNCYVLEGGYKEFFIKYQPYCEPQSYVPQSTDSDTELD